MSFSCSDKFYWGWVGSQEAESQFMPLNPERPRNRGHLVKSSYISDFFPIPYSQVVIPSLVLCRSSVYRETRKERMIREILPTTEVYEFSQLPGATECSVLWRIKDSQGKSWVCMQMELKSSEKGNNRFHRKCPTLKLYLIFSSSTGN